MRSVIPRMLFSLAFAYLAGTGISSGASAPEDSAGARSLLISPSVRVSGMGGAGVALTDEPSGYYNPAALVFTNRKWDIATTNYLGAMNRVPESPDSSMTYQYNSFSIGGEQLLLKKKRGSISALCGVSGALGYYRTKLDFSGVHSAVPGMDDGVESAHNFVFSGSARFIGELGAGATVTRVHGDFADTLRSDATAVSLGLLGRMPLVALTEYMMGRRIAFLGFRPEVEVSAGAVWNGLGSDTERSDGLADPLPRNFTSGYAGTASVASRRMGNLNLVRFTAVRETYVPKTGGRSYASICKDKKRGWEFSFCETVTIREGRFDDNDGGAHYKTRGTTVSSDGLFKILASRRTVRSKGNAIDYITNHLSLNWTGFECTESSAYDLDHSQFTVLFRL